MRLRSSASAYLLFALHAWAAASMLSCGEWKPKIGPVRSEQLLDGPARLETPLDESERYLLVSRFQTDDEGNETRRYNIVDWKNRSHCELPENVARFERSLLGPAQKRKEGPLFLLPLVLSDGETKTLAFFDELCQPHGDAEYGPIGNTAVSFTLDEDGREVMLYSNGKGTLALADPWSDERTEIGTGFRAFSFVYRAGAFSAPQLLWLIEDGKLTQRALDGTLVLSLGEHVTEFSQMLLTQVRVAYVDNGDLFEAVGPDFVPTRIAQGACRPVYRGSSLELFNPCEPSQLVRVNLMTGAATEFDPGVFEAYTDSGFTFETKRDADAHNHQWVAPPGRSEVEIVPPFVDHPFVVDPQHLAGIKELKEEGADEEAVARRALVLWSAGSEDVEVFPRKAGSIDSFYPVGDYRTSSYWWLVYHDRRDTEGVEGHQLGTLSRVSARDLSIETIATDVPLLSPLPGAPSVHGFSIEALPTFTKERAIAYIDDAVPLERDARASRGTLHVRLFSGELGSIIASDVTSYRLVNSPLPGVLYGIEEGDQQGLWFAAL